MKLLKYLIVALLACYRPVEPSDYFFTRLSPLPSWYEKAYEEVRECAGSRLLAQAVPKVSFDEIMFFVVETDTMTIDGRVRTTAYATGRDIYLVPSVRDSVRIVKHEMMHVVTQIFSHPQIFYTCNLMKGQ